ncbi:alpha/beta-hydrolase [Polyporus arcularius HHB13444]|uniref:Alpha/beta-hydrolase n=1 Tax=Polyporus arcularius HHB13444 TaxID=1314778 RepID=A0A5C3NWF2_9APHY|nr:alpha/beta-hydrolase [Polyporus arcularius HHB13444]
MPTASPADFKEPRTIFNPATCTRKGLCPVTEIHHQVGDPLESHSLYYEVHGSGPEKVVFIMGLNSSSAAWLPQVDYFGSKPEYSVLVFDNRGVGNSGAPRGPYTTSGMADDVVTLLDYIGWKEKRQIHVVGVSLGGMIAQEVASKIPERIVSLSLIVTKAGRRRLVELPSYIGLKNLMRTMMIKEPEKKIPYVLEMLYPKEWLDAKAPSDPEGRTNREIETLAYKKRIEVTRPQTFLGAISQMAAAMTHHVSPDRLRKISSAIPKVIIVTGDTDNLIDPSNSHFLKEHMPEAELVVKTGVAHGLTIQEKQWFNELLERTFKEGRERAK